MDDHSLPPPFVVGETYLDRDGEFVVVATDGDLLTYEHADGKRAEADVETKARIHRNMLLELGGRPAFRNRRITFRGRRPVGFTHSEAFPIIAAIIRQHSNSAEDFMSHERIVNALIEDGEMAPVLRQLAERDPQQKPASWWANNMVAWFSQVFTIGRSDWDRQFVRRKISGNWAYATKAERS